MNDGTTSGDEQFGFDLGEKPESGSYEPNLDEVREDLHAILTSARNATVHALWDERTLRYNKVVFPQAARWLPDEEAAQLCFAFHREVERIEALMAA